MTLDERVTALEKRVDNQEDRLSSLTRNHSALSDSWANVFEAVTQLKSRQDISGQLIAVVSQVRVRAEATAKKLDKVLELLGVPK